MTELIKGAKVFLDSCFLNKDILISDGIIADIADSIGPECADTVYSYDNCYVFPGFTDVHVHLREPGFSYKETIRTGTLAAAHGGYTTVCAMPNLQPVPDCYENIKIQLDIIRDSAVINVYPYGAITVGEKGEKLSDMESLSKVCVAFSDDGRGVQSDDMMLEAMKKAHSISKIISAHCEDNSLLQGGYIHKGKYAAEHGHLGICSESEWKPIERDLKLAEMTGAAYHVCHISTKESVELIRDAKQRGVDVTCETAPHYLTLSDKDLQESGRFKMNPPLRDESDRLALIEGICDGTIDMIATDHAPHSAEEKSKGLKDSSMGIVGLETAFSILYTKLVKTGIISLPKLITLMTVNPNRRFKIGSELKIGEKADLTVFDLDDEYKIDTAEFLSKGKSTPFEGDRVFGRCKMTICGGKTVWQEK
ncbi:MAG: dihydroorotase [Oscillospiraceae bacterium]|nr:dihydroorotase [Oscillospiraceae bacterium]